MQLFFTMSRKTKPLLSVAMSGVLATRRRIPGAFIEGIWIKRVTPFTLRNGKRVMRNRWITLLDSRSGNLPFTGWTGVQKSGYSDIFRDMMRKLRHANESITFGDVLNETAANNGYGNICYRMLSPVWSIHSQDTVMFFALWHDCHVSGRRYRAHLLR